MQLLLSHNLVFSYQATYLTMLVCYYKVLITNWDMWF